MPPSSVPIVAAIVAAFSLFIVVVCGVSIWTWLSVRKGERSDPETRG